MKVSSLFIPQEVRAMEVTSKDKIVKKENVKVGDTE